MKTKWPIIVTLALLVSGARLAATTRFVNVNNAAPSAPYTTWATAANRIQDARDVAVEGDLIRVTNGVYKTGGKTVNGYALTNRVAGCPRVAASAA
jgi:hypothetical protein